jgi:hypothetical protein
MATEESSDDSTPLDRVMEDVRTELVRRLARSDRDDHREVYDALDDE